MWRAETGCDCGLNDASDRINMATLEKTRTESAVARLLSRELDSAQLQESTDLVAQKAATQELLTQSVFIIRLGAEWLGLSTRFIDEVVDVRPIHTLPHRREAVVRGIVNVRGQLTVCVSLERLVQGVSTPAAQAPQRAQRRLVVMGYQGHRLSFEADEVLGTHRFDPHQLGTVPATIAMAMAPYSTGMLTWRGRTVGILDTELVFDAFNRRLG